MHRHNQTLFLLGTQTLYRSVQIHFQLKSHKNMFVHNIHLRSLIISKFCTEHDSMTAMLCAKFRND